MISRHCIKKLEDFETNTKNICWDFREIRAVVMCKAWQLMEEKHIPFHIAVSEAWDWAKEKCREAGAYI